MALSLMLLTAMIAPAPDVEAALKAIKSNRAAFHNHLFRYRVVFGEAKSREQISAGKWERLLTADGVYAVAGNRLFQSFILDTAEEEAWEQRPGNTQTRPDGSVGIYRMAKSFRLLDDGQSLLFVQGRGVRGAAHAEANPFRKLRSRFGPLDFGMMGDNECNSPQVLLENDWKGPCTATWICVAQRFGDEMADLRVTRFVDGKPYARYWFDTKKGNALVCQENLFGKDEVAQALTVKRIEQDGKGGWWGREALTYAMLAPNRYLVREFKTVTIEHSPPNEQFLIRLEKGSKIIHDATNFPYLTLTEDRTVTLETLPKLIREAEEAKRAREKAAADAAKPTVPAFPPAQAESSSNAAFYFGAVLIAFAVLLGTRALLRRA